MVIFKKGNTDDAVKKTYSENEKIDEEYSLKTELNKHTIKILGKPCFTCARIANELRFLGVEIPTKAEEEQAAAIHFMLNLYETHGDAWPALLDMFSIAIRSVKTDSSDVVHWILDDRISDVVHWILDDGISNEDLKREILEKFTGGKTELNKHTKWIFGRINFLCFQYVAAIRAMGHDIGDESREEQAEVIHFFLNLYEKHGEDWWTELQKLLKQIG